MRHAKPVRDMDSSEFFYLDDEGRKRDDWMHEEILNKPEADRAIAKAAIKRAIESGMDPATARRLYGIQEDDE